MTERQEHYLQIALIVLTILAALYVGYATPDRPKQVKPAAEKADNH